MAGWSWWHPQGRNVSRGPARHARVAAEATPATSCTKLSGDRALQRGQRSGDLVVRYATGPDTSEYARLTPRAPVDPITRPRKMRRDHRRSGVRRSTTLRRRQRGQARSACATLVSDGESAPRRPREGSSRECAETPSSLAARSSGSRSREIEPGRPRSQDRGRTRPTSSPLSERDLGMATLHHLACSQSCPRCLPICGWD